MKLLSIGNSFSVDSMKLMPQVAQALGMELRLGNLFVAGCSINRHLRQLEEDIPAYVFYENTGGEWTNTPDFRIRDAILADTWDWINIQHGSGDGSRYSKTESYVNLKKLIGLVRQLAPQAKISFNMTWVGDADKPRSEMPEYAGRLHDLYLDICALTREGVLPLVDRVCPTGTAIENLRLATGGPMTRDGYHLSYDLGRYTAAMAFLQALTGCDLSGISWAPESVTPEQKEMALAAVAKAMEVPFPV